MDLAKEITEFLGGERRGVKPLELIALIQRAEQHNHQWTKASVAHWEAAIESATNAGLIEMRGECLHLAPEPVAQPKPKQMGLMFE
jgi:hypothetical protein